MRHAARIACIAIEKRAPQSGQQPLEFERDDRRRLHQREQQRIAGERERVCMFDDIACRRVRGDTLHARCDRRRLHQYRGNLS